MLWHIDVQSQFPGIDTELPAYYWTNVYTWSQDSATTPDPDAVGVARAFHTGYCSGVVFIPCYRVRNADGSYDQTTYWGRQGQYGTSGSFYSQYLWYCLLRGLDSSGRMVGYKRLRGGWDERYVSGGRVSAAVVSWVESWLDRTLRLYTYTSWAGKPITSWVFDPALRCWQRRHGSKRAARPVIALP